MNKRIWRVQEMHNRDRLVQGGKGQDEGRDGTRLRVHS